MLRLSGSDRKKIADAIKADIDAYSASKNEGPRNHLGASVLGEPCQRKLVYDFRWMKPEVFEGRMMRLFNRGHLEEDRFTDLLRGIGCHLTTHTADGKQIRMGDGEHYGGSLDGVVQLPERYQLPDDWLCEMKTHNQKSFDKLIKLGVQQAKPMHYAQMMQYGAHYKLTYALYIAVNKNNDDIYVEIVPIDYSVGKKLNQKAKDVIHADRLPNRIAANESFADCKYCNKVEICHRGAPAERNCRSCINSKPVANGNWHCNRFNLQLTQDQIKVGCSDWIEFA